MILFFCSFFQLLRLQLDVRGAPVPYILGRNLPELIHMGRFSCENPLCNLSSTADEVPSLQRVSHSGGLDTNNANPGIILRAIVDSIIKVAQPRLQPNAVRLLDQLTISHNTCLARDGCPLAGAVDEGYVDMGIVGQVVGLSRFSVCVEEEVNASGFLLICQSEVNTLA